MVRALMEQVDAAEAAGSARAARIEEAGRTALKEQADAHAAELAAVRVMQALIVVAKG